MKITDITATPVILPVEEAAEASSYTKTGRGTTIVTLETDTGVTGHVHSGDVLDSNPEKAPLLRSFIEERIAPLIIGDELSAIEAGWKRALAETTKFSAYRPDERQLLVHAMGAVDIARWDALGKAAGLPLYQLWGSQAESLPVLAIGGYYHDGDYEMLAEEVREYHDRGFAGLKLKVGGRSVETDLERLATVCEVKDESFVVACDANQGYSVDEAVAFAQEAKTYGIEWFEEPVAWHEQYQGMRRVRNQTGVPVTAGQSESVASGCRQLIEADAVDIINMDASIGGGPTQWRKVAHLAEANGVSMGHHEEPQIAMHLLASVPNGLYVEAFHPSIDPVWYELVTDRPEIKDGRLSLPAEPGVGVSLDESMIAEYAVDT